MTGLIDSTLREGSQAPATYLTAEQRCEVVRALVAIGVEEIELGHAVAERAYDRGPLVELLALARDVAPGVRRAVWARAREEDVVAAAALAPEVLSFAMPVSDLHLARRLGKDRAWAVAEVGRLVSLARDVGVGYVSVGLEDATRADADFVVEMSDAADAAGADRVRIADTVGVASPAEIVGLVSRVRTWFRGEVGVHVHNDFGMATAGAVAALEAGADWADVSLLGLGERSGISRTEEVAAWLVARRGASYDLLAARSAALQAGAWVGRAVPGHAPVIGAEAFACESGLHLAGLAADPATYEPCPPELVGGERVWRLGRGAGRAAVEALMPASALDPVEAAARVRRAAVERRRALEPGEWADALMARCESSA